MVGGGRQGNGGLMDMSSQVLDRNVSRQYTRLRNCGPEAFSSHDEQLAEKYSQPKPEPPRQPIRREIALGLHKPREVLSQEVPEEIAGSCNKRDIKVWKAKKEREALAARKLDWEKRAGKVKDKPLPKGFGNGVLKRLAAAKRMKKAK